MDADLSAYRPVSGLAVTAAVAGVVSALAVVSPFFWFVPLVGGGLACLGLADVRRPAAEKAGRAAAIVGLALSIGFGAQAISATAASRWIKASRAQAAVTFWLEAIREGRAADIKSMCLPEAAAAAEKMVAIMSRPTAVCDLAVRSAGPSEDVPNGIVVQAGISCQGSPAWLTLAVHVVPETTMRHGRVIERWMIARCVPE